MSGLIAATATAPSGALSVVPFGVMHTICDFAGSGTTYHSLVALNRHWQTMLTGPAAEALWLHFYKRDFGARHTLACQKKESYIPATVGGNPTTSYVVHSIKSWRTVWARHRRRFINICLDPNDKKSALDLYDRNGWYSADAQCLMMKYWSIIFAKFREHDLLDDLETILPGMSFADFTTGLAHKSEPQPSAVHADVIAFYSVTAGQGANLVFTTKIKKR